VLMIGVPPRCGRTVRPHEFSPWLRDYSVDIGKISHVRDHRHLVPESGHGDRWGGW
jgi:hypothetical protein